MPTRPVTAVAHDYFTQRGGAERVAAAMVSIFRPDRVLTAAYQPNDTFDIITDAPIETSFVQRFKGLRRDPRRALFLLPLAWAGMKPVKTGIVLCSSSGWSHSTPIAGDARKVVYCHNPAR